MCSIKTLKNNSKKKSLTYKEKDEVKRGEYLEALQKLPSDKLIYIDESGIEKFISREYGWSKKGVKVHSEISGKRYFRESFIAGILRNKIIAPFCYQGTCNSALFNIWLKKVLLPNLNPGHIIIMDNAAFHKSRETKALIEKAKCKLLFLPPYSPDLNPIEKFWANLKNRIKKIINKFSSLQDAIDYAFKQC